MEEKYREQITKKYQHKKSHNGTNSSPLPSLHHCIIETTGSLISAIVRADKVTWMSVQLVPTVLCEVDHDACM